MKIKKQKSELIIKLKPTADILKWAGLNKNSKLKHRKRLVVGFALEDKNLLENAEKKLKQKKLDMIVANSISAIGNEKSTVYIKKPYISWQIIKNATKASIAKKIIYLMMDSTDRVIK